MMLQRFIPNIAIIFVLFSCESYQIIEIPQEPNSLEKLKAKLQNLSTGVDQLGGAELSQIYCGNCHMMPNPNMLDKKTWKENVLPDMAYRLGLKTNEGSPYKSLNIEEGYHLKIAKVYSEEKLIDSVQWNRILDYYVQNAPDTLVLREKRTLEITNQFHLKSFFSPANEFPLSTLVHIDAKDKKIYLGDANRQLSIIGFDGVKKAYEYLDSPPVDIHFTEDGEKQILTIGQMHPSDRKTGKVYLTHENAEKDTLLNYLSRAVDMTIADLNEDGLDDMIICGFGHNVGSIAWYENKGDRYERHLLNNNPGAIKAYAEDFNGDGSKDVLVLMTQGNERIDIYYNNGKGSFTVETLLAFPPVYGSSSMELVDINHDQLLDIVYCNGDNADFSIIAKPYHGIRIFENKGNMSFTETTFLPMYGVSKTLTRDFNQDGDLDILAISYFPQYNLAPEESVLYFDNSGDSNFNPLRITNSLAGHWLVMDAADVDEDGDEDILLGSMSFSFGVPDTLTQKWKTESVNLFMLENQLK